MTPGGFTCAYNGCSNNTRRTHSTSFFRFPEDPERLRVWLQRCHRLDLLGTAPKKIRNNYRICGVHFTKQMFLNDLQNRLHDHAVPQKVTRQKENVHRYANKIQQEAMPSTSATKIGENEIYSKDETVNEEIPSTDDAQMGIPEISMSDTVYKDSRIEDDGEEENRNYEAVPSTSGAVHASHVSTQTSNVLTTRTPRKRKLRRTVTQLRKKIGTLEQLQQEEKMLNIEKMDFKDLQTVLHKFLPEHIVHFVMMQAHVHKKKL